jgi:hypothetical protein
MDGNNKSKQVDDVYVYRYNNNTYAQFNANSLPS